jgi:hypothetical protein
MSDLILRTRLDILESNLKNVRAVDSIEDLRKGLQELLDLPNDPELDRALRTISKHAGDLIDKLWEAGSRVEGVESSLEQIRDQATKIRNHLREVNKAADTIKSRSLPIRGGDVWNALQEGLVDNADQQIESLQEIHGLIAASAGCDEETALRNMHEAWKLYSSKAHPDSHAVLTEYLDFLGGLAMRDTGYDGGICRLADQLIRSCGRLPGGFIWNSLTIPTRREALTETLARIIRLGFPEWTIWALPLTAHEFGHVAIVRREPILRGIDDSRMDEQGQHEMRMCLADAFAAYVMGPAYACALILLRLDPLPSSVDEGGRLADLRARSVLSMLRRMNEKAPATELPYEEIIGRLEAAWETALSQANALRTPAGGINATAVSDGDQVDVDRWTKLVADSLGPSYAFPSAAWPQVLAWLAKLESGADFGKFEVKPEDELRYVLNAAWLCRIQVDDPDRNGEIATRAHQLWEMIEGKQGAPPTVTMGRPVRASTGSGWDVSGSPKVI